MTSTHAASTEAAPDTTTRAVVVFDVSSLRFRYGPGRRAVAVFSATGQHLATCDLPREATAGEAAWFGLRAVVADGVVLLPAAETAVEPGAPTGHRVALYNPFTAHIAWTAPDGATVVFPATPSPIPGAGLPGAVTGGSAGEDGWLLTLGSTATPGRSDGPVTVPSRELDAVDAGRALAAYA